MSLASEKEGKIRCSGNFSERRKLSFYCSLVRFELSSSHFDREEMSSSLALLDPCPQSALVQTAQEQKHLVTNVESTKAVNFLNV